MVVSRADWAKRNLATFSHLLAPLESKIAEKLEESGSKGAPALMARQVVAIETGALLGFLARRVLGQYELVLPTGDKGDVVAVVGANVLALERQQQLKPADFRLWIALHEATHRAQFVGVPWIREIFLEPRHRTGRVGRTYAGTDRPFGGRGGGRGPAGPARSSTTRAYWGLLATPEQRQTIDKVQALMSLLEGPRSCGDGSNRRPDPDDPGEDVVDSEGAAGRSPHRRLPPTDRHGDEDATVRDGREVHHRRGEGKLGGRPSTRHGWAPSGCQLCPRSNSRPNGCNASARRTVRMQSPNDSIFPSVPGSSPSPAAPTRPPLPG